MTENELQQAYEELKSSYNYHDHRPQTRQGQEMLKQDEERFIDEALLPYLKQIAVQFTKDLRNSISIRFNIMPNADIELKRIATGKTSLTPKPSHSSEPRKAASNLRISLPQGNIIQEYNASETMCAAIKFVIEIMGIDKVQQAIQSYNIVCDGESLVKRGPHNHPDSNSKSIGNGYYVNTHMNTKTKKEKLEKLGNALGLHWTIFIIN
ncbi:hypothetical protein [uncultured Fibrobacter sp.]|uniref:hypothetical protein n=1 Tax=uncultured Fibrobacter sp. TaxID=261512 RepID=UPI0025E770B1|nr:hypothetical protein [uncultured Fibrobacter sp.]